MPKYSPMPVEIHLARGHCCEADPQCKLCPYHGARQAKKVWTRPRAATDPLLIDYIKRAASGEKLTYYSSKQSLVSSIVISENLTISYQLYKSKNV